MGPADRLNPRFRKAKVPDLAFRNQLLHGTRHVFDRHVGVDAMLIEEVDGVDVEPMEGFLGGLLDVLGPAIQADLLAFGTEFEAEFGCDHHLTAERSQRFAHELFVRERTVGLGGVEERNAAFDRRPDQGDHLLLVGGRAVAVAHSHASEPESRHLQLAVSQSSLPHSRLQSQAVANSRCKDGDCCASRSPSGILPPTRAARPEDISRFPSEYSF
jgi:hypothetical protein